MDIYVYERAFKKGRLIEGSPGLPRVGDRVDMFYSPAPKVVDVIFWPSKYTLNAVGCADDVIAVVILDSYGA